MLKFVLFDLDGTLLPMDTDAFIEGYFHLLLQYAAAHGYEPHAFGDAVWRGTGAMIRNNGDASNEEIFWNIFSSLLGKNALASKPLFDSFYESEFQKAKALCGYNPAAESTVKRIREMGLSTVLATNPVFPAVATESRIRWAGLSPTDFLFCTTYDNIGFCKPNPDYYREILRRLSAAPEECLMVGNDTADDMIARETGMRVFLLTDHLINKEKKDISAYPHGGFEDLLSYLEKSNDE